MLAPLCPLALLLPIALRIYSSWNALLLKPAYLFWRPFIKKELSLSILPGYTLKVFSVRDY